MPEKSVATIELLDAVSKLTADLARLETETNVQHREKMQKLADIEAQAKYTNGRVTALERKLDKQDAVEEYKRQQAANQPSFQAVKVETNNAWDWKTVLAILLTLATAVAAIAGVTGK